jgi:alkylation response protein AidB-like acyl-CoA dehydrogenase
MDFGLSEEQTLLADSVARLLSDCAPLARTRRFAESEETRALDVWQAVTELGLPGLMIDEAHGGSGLGALEAALVAECLGAHVAPVPYVASCVLTPLALQRAGSPAQCAQWLPKLASGSVTAGVALSELCGAREDAGVHHDGERLSGRALFVLDFEADVYLVATRDGRLFLVPREAAGLTRRALISIDRTRRIGELLLHEVRGEWLPGSDDVHVARELIAHGRVMHAADTLGAAQSMLDQAVAYAGAREQFGRVIGSFQAVKHLCAEMAAQLEPSRALVWYAAHALNALPQEAELYACHAKAHLAEVGSFIARTATEVHGGMGFTDLLGLHYWFKRIGLNRQLLGSPERARHEAATLQGWG